MLIINTATPHKSSKGAELMEKKDRKRIYFALLISLTVSGTIVICSMGRTIKRQRAEAQVPQELTEVHEPLYTVREYEGRIAVFRRNLDKPYRVIDFDTSLLSEYDREQLAEGIAFETDTELRAYIEDIST